ncbi:TIGR01620 family protein [Candidatus Albibeggiatoa sp. nov. NOAA]|uniref:TIGR01620 family protein n=1 Tax=Candidatus Albibeggiatoa sp. nov. NOAA TaxID=3162724 RepID=UPI0032F4B46A|nr:TIGR01620 family protein [Thiotrichaceae bacterium]
MTTTAWATPKIFDLDAVENVEEEQKVELNYTQPVIIPADATLKTNALLMAHEPDTSDYDEWDSVDVNYAGGAAAIAPNAPTRQLDNVSLWGWLGVSLGSFLLLALVVDTALFLDEQYDNSFVLGTVFLVLITGITATALGLTYRSYNKILQLKTVSELQAEGFQLFDSQGHGRAMPYVNRVASLYLERPDMKGNLNQFYAAVTDAHHDQEVYELFTQKVMSDLDKQAYQIVVQRSKETALLTMLSQIGLLDVIFTLWRNTALVKDIATLYSGRPGFIGSFMLFGAVIQNLLYADVSEAAADGMAEILGGSVLSVMSGQMAQGLGSGVMTARVGLQAMQNCRPMPFDEKNKPRLRHVRKEIVKSMTEVFSKKDSAGTAG